LRLAESEPPAAQFRVKVEVREPTRTGFATKVIVQELEAARSEVPQESETIEKSNEFERVPAEQPVADPSPEFEIVRVAVLEVLPVSTEPKFKEFGAMESDGSVPFAVMSWEVVEAVPPTPQVRVRVATAAPRVWGLARMETSQVEVGGRLVVVHVSVTMVKSVVLSSAGAEQLIALAVPEFARVRVWLEEWLPKLTFPKSKESGDQASMG
jgi:hypothetical protein